LAKRYISSTVSSANEIASASPLHKGVLSRRNLVNSVDLSGTGASRACRHNSRNIYLIPENSHELRLKIWKKSLTSRFIIYKSISELPVPTLLHVCKESREEALKYYELKPNKEDYENCIANFSIFTSEAKKFMAPPRYFNKRDTFIINVRPWGWSRFRMRRYDKVVFNDLEHIAVTKECWESLYEHAERLTDHLPPHTFATSQAKLAWAIWSVSGLQRAPGMKLMILRSSNKELNSSSIDPEVEAEVDIEYFEDSV
jgi:hypothetical protein